MLFIEADPPCSGITGISTSFSSPTFLDYFNRCVYRSTSGSTSLAKLLRRTRLKVLVTMSLTKGVHIAVFITYRPCKFKLRPTSAWCTLGQGSPVTL